MQTKPQIIAPAFMKDRRVLFIAVERCIIHQNRYALTFQDFSGKIEIPAGQIAVLMLASGTSISSQAVRICAEMGVTIIWTAGGATSYYAHGSPISKSSRIISRQALLHSNLKERTDVSRKMFNLRFPDITYEDLKKYSIEQLRAKEGARVKAAYRELALKHGIKWTNRITQIDRIPEIDTLNRAITVGNNILYGIVHSTIIGIGASPALGYIHDGHSHSFIYDIADLYKTEMILPVAFRISKENNNQEPPYSTSKIDALMRKELRELFWKEKIIKRIIKDIKHLLMLENQEIFDGADVLCLWGKEQIIEAGYNQSPQRDK